MRTLILLLTGLVAPLVLVAPAAAQVTTNDNALDSLKPKAPAPAQSDVFTPATGEPEATPAHPVRHTTHHAAPAHTAGHPAATAASKAAAKPGSKAGPVPIVPLAPPTNPVILPPPQSLPVHTKPTPPPVPIKADALGAPSFIPGGIRLTFGPDSAELNPANDEALLDIAARAKADPLLSVSITAWAPGTNEDPSTPRRLSLDRALAARAVLINAGVVSERVFAVAKGFLNIEGGPPDRLDIALLHPKSTPQGAPVSTTAKPPAPPP
jgi:outer membrane protein OmpA-like peptidoglycan-associated protein